MRLLIWNPKQLYLRMLVVCNLHDYSPLAGHARVICLRWFGVLSSYCDLQIILCVEQGSWRKLSQYLSRCLSLICWLRYRLVRSFLSFTLQFILFPRLNFIVCWIAYGIYPLLTWLQSFSMMRSTTTKCILTLEQADIAWRRRAKASNSIQRVTGTDCNFRHHRF